jgi:hypothetical protein
MTKNEILHKEIDLIQDCIKRMANNSFLIKGWMLSISGIILAIVFNKDTSNIYPATWIIGAVIFCFWYLDAYFLRMERMYRYLYEWVISHRLESEDFMYDLNPNRFKSKVTSSFSVMFSETLWIFYFFPMLILLIVNLIHYF